MQSIGSSPPVRRYQDKKKKKKVVVVVVALVVVVVKYQTIFFSWYLLVMRVGNFPEKFSKKNIYHLFLFTLIFL